MDKYTAEPSLWANGILVNGDRATCKKIISNIEKLQAIVEAVEKAVKGNRLGTPVCIVRAYEEGFPKTIQQLQDERNSAADAVCLSVDDCHAQNVLLNRVAAYRESCQAHEAALAKQTGE